jgi:phosphoglycerate dehydrogenase-like enzyme
VIQGKLRTARYVFACNFCLTPYINELKDTELVVLAETGIVNIDRELALAAGIRFTNIPGYSTDAVVHYVLRCVLESLRPWKAVFDAGTEIPREQKIGVGLESKTVGLVGFGHVGRKLAELFSLLGCGVRANTRRFFCHETVKWTPVKSLFSLSDVVIVCCELNNSSEGMIGADILARLPEGGVLVSVAHRDVFVASDLPKIFQRKPNLRAWLDFDPRTEDEMLRKCPNVHLSPHLAFYTRQTVHNRPHRCIDQLEAFLNGAEVGPTD